MNQKGEKVKKEEKKERKSVLDGIPRHVALSQAEKMQKKAAKLGFDWSKQEDIIEKIQEELDELKAELKNGDDVRIDSESGDLLFAVINFIRFRKRHAEDVLADTNAKFSRQFRFVEANMSTNASIDEMEKLWQQAIVRHFNAKSFADHVKTRGNVFEPFMTENFYLDGKGVHFIYDPYEIDCFAAGTIDIFVPWKMPR